MLGKPAKEPFCPILDTTGRWKKVFLASAVVVYGQH
jgi:hypothetical protein